MKFLKVALVALVLLVNLIIAPPSWADQNFTKGADYQEVTESLNQLLQAKDHPEQLNLTPEAYQQRLGQLQQQKYVLETATSRAQCHNETNKTLAVYASSKKRPTQLYYLAAGETTDDDWDCDGLLLPADTQVSAGPGATVQTLAAATAFKVVDGTQLIVRNNAETGEIDLNITPARVFEAGATDWSVPALSQADIEAATPSPELID